MYCVSIPLGSIYRQDFIALLVAATIVSIPLGSIYSEISPFRRREYD